MMHAMVLGDSAPRRRTARWTSRRRAPPRPPRPWRRRRLLITRGPRSSHASRSSRCGGDAPAPHDTVVAVRRVEHGLARRVEGLVAVVARRRRRRARQQRHQPRGASSASSSPASRSAASATPASPQRRRSAPSRDRKRYNERGRAVERREPARTRRPARGRVDDDDGGECEAARRAPPTALSASRGPRRRRAGHDLPRLGASTAETAQQPTVAASVDTSSLRAARAARRTRRRRADDDDAAAAVGGRQISSQSWVTGGASCGARGSGERRQQPSFERLIDR